MTPRLYVDLALSEGAAIPLDADQRHYLRNVLRREENDPVRLFNPRDGEFAATLERLSKKAAIVRLDARLRAPESEPDLWLLIAPIKKNPLDLIAQKATELGVGRIVPVLTQRADATRLNVKRLTAIAREAAEQCGRLSVPSVAESAPLDSLLADWPGERRLLFCDEAGDDPDAAWGGEQGRAPPVLAALAAQQPGAFAVLVGPEGGFAPSERALLRAQSFVIPATLGPRVLRADTAAIAALTLYQAGLGDLRRA